MTIYAYTCSSCSTVLQDSIYMFQLFDCVTGLYIHVPAVRLYYRTVYTRSSCSTVLEGSIHTFQLFAVLQDSIYTFQLFDCVTGQFIHVPVVRLCYRTVYTCSSCSTVLQDSIYTFQLFDCVRG